MPLNTNVNGICVKPALAAAVAPALEPADGEVPEPEPETIEEKSTFFWCVACASW